MQLFRDVINECGFLDLGFVGSKYTWQKCFTEGHSIWERLDQGLATNDWLMQFACTKIHHLSSDSLDHCSLWIMLDGLETPYITKPFIFEEMQLLDRGYSDIVETVQSSQEVDDPTVKVVQKIEKCGRELKRWNQNHFGNVKRELEKKRKLFVEVEREAMRTSLNFWIRELKIEFNELIDKENRMWFQRSKVLWASYGDRKSKFFHS